MLTLYHGGRHYPIHNTEYYLRELASGFDEIQFSISIWDPVYAMIQEEEQIYDRGGQRYLVKQIDGGSDEAKVICVLDLDAWKGALHVGYTNGSATLGQTLEGITPEGWTVMDLSGSNMVLIYGDNEAGKSTVAEFMRSTMFPGKNCPLCVCPESA